MGMSYEEAIAQITGPGGPFEITEAVIRGQRLRVFKNTPPSLRALFDRARARGDADLPRLRGRALELRRDDARTSTRSAPRSSHRFGVAPGDRVAIAMRNYPEWIIAFAAITSVGGVAVSLNAWWTTDETRLRPARLGQPRADRRRRARSSARRRRSAALGIRAIAVRSGGAALPGRRASATKTSSLLGARAARGRDRSRTPTRRSSTPRAPRAARRARSRRTTRCSRRCSCFALPRGRAAMLLARARPSQQRSTRPASSSRCRSSTSRAASR